MKLFSRHLIIPLLVTVVFFTIAFSPVQLLGCRTRGLLALLVATVSGLASLAAAITGARVGLKGCENAMWWTTSSLILAIPVVALLVLA